ncbi:MAG: sialate O-acetylesterase [Novosphingobium sp.]
MRTLVMIVLLGTSTSAIAASLAVDAPVTAHAVLQRDRAVPLTGTAQADASVSVTFDGAEQTAKADKTGHWQLTLPAHQAGGPYAIEVQSGQESTRLEDVMVGDVWLCSGQSNMEFTLRHATNADAEVGGATNPALRLFNVPRQTSPVPSNTFSAPVSWQRSSPDSAADFSAACFFMGRELQAHQNIPVGLIASSWGGSPIEAWISKEAYATIAQDGRANELLDLYAVDPIKARALWGQQVVGWLGKAAKAPLNAAWRSVPVTMAWEKWGDPDLEFFDGVGYYRAHVTLTPKQVGKATLSVGMVDDVDVTSINGKMVGANETWDKPRVYQVPVGIFKAGDNVIDLVAIDTGGGGGMWGEVPRTLKLADGSTIALSDWTFAKGRALSEKAASSGLTSLSGTSRSSLFNGMIAPLHGYPVKGFAWYQGEANVADAHGYAKLMPLLIADWRGRFGGPTFTMVQLANFGPLLTRPQDDSWARLRDVQRRVADAEPQVGMASAVDVGEIADIHPTNKQTVGHRLALAARQLALGEPVESRGPSPTSVKRSEVGITVRFAHGPLKLVGGGDALGFELCDAAGACRFVPGHLSSDTITLPADPTASEVRYLWQASPLVNLYNDSGLPATGFAMPIK